MPNESDLKAEIGHVLFLDIVGYSRRLITEQSALLATLNQLVRESAPVQEAQDEDALIRLPTGDGMALVFRRHLEQAVECALALSAGLKQHPELPLRMGIHSGPINRVLDVNEHANVAGAGIDLAQRVMDCGDAGHILLSKRAADDLAPYPRWNPHLHDLGEIEVKHRVLVHLVNLFTDTEGNAATPSSITNTRAPLLASPAPRRNLVPWLLAAIALIWLGGAVWWFASRSREPVAPNESTRQTVPVAPEKSIAVLPFENLSTEKDNAYFADGIQDEILTNLAKIADLKVISRTSVMQYRSGAARNLRQIARQLDVANVLEGSVQRAAGKVRVNAQLIDARTDTHLWAQTYDRDLADIFAIQSDIARAIAQQLQATLAPAEKARLDRKPTDSSEAYLLYLQANELVHIAASRDEVVQAERLYTQAIALDPGFTLVRARASMLSSLMYMVGRDPVRKERARTLADEALRRAPELGEAHLALGLCHYRIEHDYPAALKELDLASETLPNNSEILFSTGLIYRRQGRWRDALAVFARSAELDPRQANFDGTAGTLRTLRQWPEASVAYERGLQFEPQLNDGWVGMAYTQFAQNGSTEKARATLDQLGAEMKTKPGVQEARWNYAILARDFAAAEALTPDRPLDEFPAIEPAGWFRACAAVAQGDRAGAEAHLQEIQPLYESAAHDHPDEPLFHMLLGKLYALLGREEEALREAGRAVELCPESKDAVSGPVYAAGLAFVQAQTGDADAAIAALTRLLTTPDAEEITVAHLRLSWEWDPLRQDPRFQGLLTSPEPATIYR